MAKTNVHPATSEHAWRVVAADGSHCAIDGVKALGITRPEPEAIVELLECRDVRPNAAMPQAGVELTGFVMAARKTGLYRRGDDAPAVAEPAKPDLLENGNGRPALANALPPQRSAEMPPETPTFLHPAVADDGREPDAFLSAEMPSPPETDPNLARVVRLWPALPLGIQAGILAMVEATIAEKAYTQPAGRA